MIKAIITAVWIFLSGNVSFAESVKKTDLRCKKDEDCVVVNSACSKYVAMALAKKAEQHHNEVLKEKCPLNLGPALSLAEGGPVTVICEKGQCQLQSAVSP